MKRETVLMRIALAAVLPTLFTASFGACTRTGTVPVPAEPTPRTPPPAERPAEETPAEAAEEPYDLEDEMPVESGPARKVEEDIEPVKPDTFSVEEPVQPPEAGQYVLGYRIQVFASGNLEAAREIQKKVMAGTGLAAYIEFEEGLYKVRAGDYSTREEASAARTALAQTYPDCWIVRTTVRTIR